MALWQFVQEYCCGLIAPVLHCTPGKIFICGFVTICIRILFLYHTLKHFKTRKWSCGWSGSLSILYHHYFQSHSSHILPCFTESFVIWDEKFTKERKHDIKKSHRQVFFLHLKILYIGSGWKQCKSFNFCRNNIKIWNKMFSYLFIPYYAVPIYSAIYL